MIEIKLPDYAVTSTRLLLIICTIITGINVNEFSLSFLLLTLVSLYCLKKYSKSSKNINISVANKLENPFKSQKKINISQLPPEIIEKAKNELFEHFHLDYSYAYSLKAFEEIKNKSECIFAKNSNLWGSAKWNDSLTVKENVELQIIPQFILFCNLCASLKLDGFLVQLPGDKFGKDLQSFSEAFKEILAALADSDPSGRNCMKTIIERPGWVFEFSKITFFITTFSPCYPENNSRYTHGVNECFILFQPEISFASHDLPEDTIVTNWDNPKTVRDKIRVNFKNNNREYLIRDTISYQMCHDIIKPLNKNDEVVKWWA